MALKTVTYRRAVWLTEQQSDLEELILQAQGELPLVEDRKVNRGQGQVLKCLRMQRSTNGGVLLHIVAETPGDAASVLPSRQDRARSGDVGTAPPPDGTEYMDGDIFAYVVSNHVCVCSTGLREATLGFYLYGLFNTASLEDEASQFELQPVGDANKLQMIAQGVKRIDLGATVHDATIAYARRTNEPSDLLGAVGRELRRLLGNDVRDIEDNLQMSVSIYSDGRLKGGAPIGEGRLQRLARDLIDSQQDDYVIVTKGGQSISQSEVFIRAKMDMTKFGKSVSRASAWEALRQFYASLTEIGVTEE